MNHILAIDDKHDNLVTVKALLKLFISDCNVITALSGDEGIQKARSEQPDTILLDIHMPGMDGFEVCKQLKTSMETAHIPIIMFTAIRTDSKSRVKALEQGADAFLSKPIDESELAAQVKAMLRIKRAEDKLRNEKDHLEKLVAQRVNDLSIANEQLVMEMKERKILEKQLIQAQKMEAVGALAGGIAHDFNNILYPIIGFAELLKEDIEQQDPMYESAEEIFQAAVRAKGLVKQILTFSRQMDQEIKPVRIQSVLKEALSLTHSIIPSTIIIEEKIDNNCRPVLADQTQIHQVIMNLITNAYHAMQDKGGTLSVCLEQMKLSKDILKNKRILPGDYLYLSIMDTGSGIPKDILSNIFDPYFTTKGADKGTGLGLSVVHGIIKNTHGEIFVESTPGKGTCFEVYLPSLKENNAELSLKNPVLLKGNERILLVDDEPHVSKIETRMLERLGYQVTEKNNPIEALDLFSQQPDQYDLLMTDLTMPGLTGKQLSRKVLGINPVFPIIICTGFSENMDEDEAERIGAKAFLMKPIVLSDMAQVVRRILDNHSLTQ